MKGLWMWLQGPFSQHFFLRNLRKNNELMLHFSRLESLAKDKRSSLLGSFICYEENEVWIRLRILTHRVRYGWKCLVVYTANSLNQSDRYMSRKLYKTGHWSKSRLMYCLYLWPSLFTGEIMEKISYCQSNDDSDYFCIETQPFLQWLRLQHCHRSKW